VVVPEVREEVEPRVDTGNVATARDSGLTLEISFRDIRATT
jgi:hypothetical protein